MSSSRSHPSILLLALALALGGCGTIADPAPPTAERAALTEINAAVNRQGQPCPDDACLEDWPDVADLEWLDYWDCKAYAVAKADRLIRQGYDPARLEYLLIEGPPLRVAHAALLVDGHWVLDSGPRCQDVCALERFTAGLRVTGRLPVAELPYLRQALGITKRR
ncbi:MAG: transglutaminase-like cysteine peptidase [Candidatus Contendobacter sp.]|nr:transglutaminase-like cysteine peptidase [Candidatus Contendobacter sp.]MDG4558550.1 transglutaminase-like cysteine peptidase [Candidatus Contendobacter sp.]